MKWLYRNLYRKEKGFTLVELMIVIIILAILTGIAVPSYMVLRTRARIVATKAELKNIATALGIYEVDFDGYPMSANIGALAADLSAAGCMDTVPTVDAWGTAYVYAHAAAPGGTGPGHAYAPTYTLTSYGEDGDSGGNDNLTIISGQPSWS